MIKIARRSLLSIVLMACAAPYAGAQSTAPLPGTHTTASAYGFDALATRLEKAIEANKMGLVAQASASRGAAARGVKIPGNLVLMVFRNDYAVRMLAASVPAGVEAPLRLYVTEDANGKAVQVEFTPHGAEFYVAAKGTEGQVHAEGLDRLAAQLAA